MLSSFEVNNKLDTFSNVNMGENTDIFEKKPATDISSDIDIYLESTNVDQISELVNESSEQIQHTVNQQLKSISS